MVGFVSGLGLGPVARSVVRFSANKKLLLLLFVQIAELFREIS